MGVFRKYMVAGVGLMELTVYHLNPVGGQLDVIRYVQNIRIDFL
jgi:hypothetical protein